jgi:hypothetical protein
VINTPAVDHLEEKVVSCIEHQKLHQIICKANMLLSAPAIDHVEEEVVRSQPVEVRVDPARPQQPRQLLVELTHLLIVLPIPDKTTLEAAAITAIHASTAVM